MFDYVFITHLPSFYKINLYNEIAKSLKICVVFVGSNSDIRTKDFIAGKMNFPFYFLSQNCFERRNKLLTSIKLLALSKKLKFKKIVVGGWDLIEFWLAVFLNRKKTNCLALESSLNDCRISGIRGFVKKFFLKKIGLIFASGKNHAALAKTLNFTGEIVLTKGVGLINKITFEQKEHPFKNKFLYVGRLSGEKNLDLLIETFNELPEFTLSIAGTGKDQEILRQKALQNIHFWGHIKNEEISKIYNESDIFILPSIAEPWGLVVEEALYYKLPIILSDNVGCAPELLNSGQNGEQFKHNSKSSLIAAIKKVSNNYELYRAGAEKFDIIKKDQEQISAYLNQNKK